MAGGIEVSLLGQTLTLRTDLPPERLQAIVDYVRRKAEAAGRGVLTGSPASLALLTALNVAEELFAAEARAVAGEAALREIEARLARLVERIDQGSPAALVMGADPLSR